MSKDAGFGSCISALQTCFCAFSWSNICDPYFIPAVLFGGLHFPRVGKVTRCAQGPWVHMFIKVHRGNSLIVSEEQQNPQLMLGPSKDSKSRFRNAGTSGCCWFFTLGSCVLLVKFCFLKKQSLRYPALLFMRGCVPLPFPGLSESWFAPICERSTATNNITFLKALRNLAAGHQDSLQWGREAEDASSLSPQRHCFMHWENCDGNLHLKAQQWREVHETSTSVSSYRTAVSSML